MRELLVIADPVTADVFRLGGMDVWATGDNVSPQQLLLEAVDRKYDVIFLADSVAHGIDIEAVQSIGDPVVVVIPAMGSTEMRGSESLLKLSRAILGIGLNV